MKIFILDLFFVFTYASVSADKCGPAFDKMMNVPMMKRIFTSRSTKDSALTYSAFCKSMSKCYVDMLDALHEQEEAHCIEDAAIGTSTITVYLKALEEFCGLKVKVTVGATTADSRNLYEVVIHESKESDTRQGQEPPVIIIDAGQEAGLESVRFALYIIQNLVACEENKDMIEQAKWVIMPSTNPDGMELSKYRKSDWRKNLKVSDDLNSFGVDISRNFDESWAVCEKENRGFAPNYPGPFSFSEKESIFLKNVIDKYKAAKIYLSIRRDGHHIGFPFAYSDNRAPNRVPLEMVAGEVANKVNVRSGGVSTFKNDSIYKLEGKERCGHSVDYAYAAGIKFSFEMRTFLESDSRITSMFQNMPKGYEGTLRSGYLTAIRELYSVLTNKKKYGHLWERKL